MKHVLAIDLGASSGRAVLGAFDGRKICMEEVHRFENHPVQLGGTLYWDVLRLYHEICVSLQKVRQVHIDSVGIDTWGVDFGLIGANGRLLANPVHYRDGRTRGMLEAALKTVPAEELYAHTGNQFMEINTLFQLMAVQQQEPALMAQVQTMLPMPNLFTYFLTGQRAAERSIASTTQLYDPTTGNWAYDIAGRLGIAQSILPPIVEPGTSLGRLSAEVCETLQIPSCQVTAVCGHDTQCAMAAVPCMDSRFAFISSGTWSLLGTECDKPLLDRTHMEAKLTNEAAYGGKTAFLKNITGLWLIQEVRRQFENEGRAYTFADLETIAREAEPLRSHIHPNDEQFNKPGNIPQRIRSYCQATNQPLPMTDGAVVRCIYESLAMEYRHTLQEIEACTGQHFERLYIIGGGAKDHFLSQLTADFCGIEVSAGPAEATALGNLAIQLLSLGEVRTIEEARLCVAVSTEIRRFRPQADAALAINLAYDRWQRL